MLHTVKLLLPALIPSWRFFDTIAPSPRIEYVLLKSPEDYVGEHWQAFWPRPKRVSIGRMMVRMIWNPHWNETLFVVSLSERLIENPTEHSRKEISRRIRDMCRDLEGVEATPYFQFRLVLLSRDGGQLRESVAYISSVESTHDGAAYDS